MKTSKMREGQVMILTVSTIGGALLGASTIAGLLMLYQIQQATNLESSAKAIYAADTGIEWAFYDFECHNAYPNDVLPLCHVPPPGASLGSAEDGYLFDFNGDNINDPQEAMFRLKTEEMGVGMFNNVVASTTERIISTGSSGIFGRAASRAFELILF